MKNVLITGGSGYSGNNLTNYLSKKKIPTLSSYYKNKALKKNYIKVNLLKKININFDINIIVHTASHHKIQDFKKNPRLKYKNNIKMVKNLINFAKTHKIEKFIFYSTFDLNYPKKNLKKKFYIESKIECEKLLIAAHKKNIFKKLFILRIPAIIGKNANLTFISGVFNKLIKSQKIYLWNHNKKFDKIINIHDLNNLIFYLINFKPYKKIYFIDCLSSRSLKLIDIITLMKKKTASKSKILLSNNQINKNIPKLNRKINFKFYSLKKALITFMNNCLS